MPVPGSGQFDASKPSPARVTNYLLGGKDNFAADREEADRLTDPRQGYPGMRQLVQDGRRFGLKAVTWAAGRGIAQYLDLGCGLPLHPSVHETARAEEPGSRVVYADNDPLVMSHVRAVQAAGEGLAAVEADPADPEAVLADPATAGVIDLGEPVCVLFSAVLHFLPADEAREVVAGYMKPLAAGSVAVIRTSRCEDPGLAARLARLYTAGRWFNHSPADVAGFFEAAGLEMAWGPAGNVRQWLMLPSANGRQAAVIGGVGVLG